MQDSILHVKQVFKVYETAAGPVPVLKGVDLELEAGAFVALIGPSGSGKSTLLNLIAGLDRPSSGSIRVGSDVITTMSEAEIARWRSTHLGFIFQFYHLIPVLTAYENVELPLLLFGLSGSRRRKQVLTALSLVGLRHRMSHRPGQMSGGEQQRVGIARALVTDPTLIVADEPTGDLDGKTSEEILDLLQAVRDRCGKTILLVTHDFNAAARAERFVQMHEGQLRDGTAQSLREAFPAFANLS